MGIKGLWTVLTPYSEKKSLHEIRGETIAVDLSGWICDSQNVADYYIQPKLYLRNLFFRTAYLLLADINPIFVLEGDAPELKRDVMAARNAIQFRGAAPRSENATKKKPDVARKRFKGILKECENLLKCMGVRCVKGSGEAEATCAQLNAQGLVDAVVSQDSDCFAYGARRVYRNFSVSNAAGGGAMAGSVDCYDADVMIQSNGFGRNKMVALALLCGCDYGVGACGSSITTALSFLHTVPDNEVIPRLLSWISDTEHYEERARWVSAPGRCERCGHSGRSHTKNGCPTCTTHRGCNDLGHKSKVAEVKKELSLRNRALTCGMPFPEPKVMKEFLKSTPENIDLDALRTPTPSLIQFVKLMTYKLDWSERYCVEKFLPLLTKWHLQDNVTNRTLKPIAIKKKRNPRGVPSYEVIWGDIDGQYEALIPDDQIKDDEDSSAPWTTTERQDLMKQYFPDLVESYEESIKKPAKEKKTKSKSKTDGKPDRPKRKHKEKAKDDIEIVQNLNISMKNLNIQAVTGDLNCSNKSILSVSINKLKRKLKTKKNQRTIDSFMKHKRRKSLKRPTPNTSLKDFSRFYDNIRDKYLRNGKENENMEIKESENLLSMLEITHNSINDSELSDIVEKMVISAPAVKTAKVENNLYKFIFEKYSTPKKTGRKSVFNEIHNYCSTPKDSPVSRSCKFIGNDSNNSITSAVNTSYFFDKVTTDRDAFELSMDYKHKSALIVSLSCDTTIDYSLPDVCL